MTARMHHVRRITIVLAAFISPLAARAYDFAGGTGEPNDPYQIATAGQLIAIGSDPNLFDKHFVLLNDLDLDPNLPGGRVFTRALIAPTWGRNTAWYTGGVPFTGSFDGGGHAVRHLTMRGGTTGYLGLFGGIGRQGVVKDLGLTEADISDAGVLCATLVATNDGFISRCYARSRVSGGSSVGGLVGDNAGEIVDCWAEGEVTARTVGGGLVGLNGDGTLRNSHASVRVSSMDYMEGGIGGLAGDNYASIVNCHATGDVSALMRAGGLVGANYGSIVNCHATGSVSATRGQSLGGLVGENNAVITRSFATGSVSGGTSAYGTRGGKLAGSVGLGGLVGADSGSHIFACCASGDVSGADHSSGLGGLVGSLEGDIVDSYSVGRVRAGADSTKIGGLVGNGGRGVVAGFWDIEASGLSESGGGTGLTTAQMQDTATFVAAGWDWAGERVNGTADLWFIPETGGYPALTIGSEAFQRHPLDGSGTPDDPYRIATAEDLGAINHYDLAGCYRLEADVNLAGIAWKEPPVPYFAGRLDGAGRTVANMSIHGGLDLALFGELGRQACVTNLGVDRAAVTGTYRVALLVARNSGVILTCRTSGTTVGTSVVGGLAAVNDGSISDSYAAGVVTAKLGEDLGGFVGWNYGAIHRCYAAARVSWTVRSDYAYGPPGGLVGLNNRFDTAGDIRDSYFLIDPEGGGPDNGFGTPLTVVQMQQKGSFPAWDFDTLWQICEGSDYPRLRWENTGCGE